MKTILNTVLVTYLGLSCASGQDKANIRVNLNVADDLGKAVQDATTTTFVFKYWQPGEGSGKDVFERLDTNTNKSGSAFFEASSSRCELTLRTSKQGYYESQHGFKSTTKQDGHWQPWNATVQIELKRILNPIPLKAKTVAPSPGAYTPFPLIGKNVGFDLEVGDWVAPHGKGQKSDLLFHQDTKVEALGTPYETHLRISFSNPEDGLLLYETDATGGSRLRMPYLAPESGYLPEGKWRKARIAGAISGPNRGIDQLIDETKPNENYFLRVRTTLGEKGEIISAHYAKVQGGFLWGPEGVVKFQYYFNPTPNDRNLEFDPKRNLLDVLPGQEVKDP